MMSVNIHHVSYVYRSLDNPRAWRVNQGTKAATNLYLGKSATIGEIVSRHGVTYREILDGNTSIVLFGSRASLNLRSVPAWQYAATCT
jgi:hypothetical protein